HQGASKGEAWLRVSCCDELTSGGSGRQPRQPSGRCWKRSSLLDESRVAAVTRQNAGIHLTSDLLQDSSNLVCVGNVAAVSGSSARKMRPRKLARFSTRCATG